MISFAVYSFVMLCYCQNDNTALIMAADCGNPRCVDLLLAAKAAKDVQNKALISLFFVAICVIANVT